jgi:hypothetical protein
VDRLLSRVALVLAAGLAAGTAALVSACGPAADAGTTPVDSFPSHSPADAAACAHVEVAANQLKRDLTADGAAAFIVILTDAQTQAKDSAVIKAFADEAQALGDATDQLPAITEIRTACKPYIGVNF